MSLPFKSNVGTPQGDGRVTVLADNLGVNRSRVESELVAEHLLGHVDRHKPHSIVNDKGEPDHLWNDGRAAAPSLDDFVASGLSSPLDLLPKMGVNKRSLAN